jgi:hypothetical protein
MKLSNNLSLAEMTKSSTAQRRGIDNMPTPEHMENMKVLAAKIFQPIREHFNRPILISSGYRSKALNDAIGGSQTSQHSIGEAIDIDMDGTTLSNTDVFNYIKDNLDFDQLIWEFGNEEKPDWVHVSYKANGPQRKSILVAKKINNKTTYQNYGG